MKSAYQIAEHVQDRVDLALLCCPFQDGLKYGIMAVNVVTRFEITMSPFS